MSPWPGLGPGIHLKRLIYNGQEDVVWNLPLLSYGSRLQNWDYPILLLFSEKCWGLVSTLLPGMPLLRKLACKFSLRCTADGEARFLLPWKRLELLPNVCFMCLPACSDALLQLHVRIFTFLILTEETRDSHTAESLVWRRLETSLDSMLSGPGLEGCARICCPPQLIFFLPRCRFYIFCDRRLHDSPYSSGILIFLCQDNGRKQKRLFSFGTYCI